MASRCLAWEPNIGGIGLEYWELGESGARFEGISLGLLASVPGLSRRWLKIRDLLVRSKCWLLLSTDVFGLIFPFSSSWFRYHSVKVWYSLYHKGSLRPSVGNYLISMSGVSVPRLQNFDVSDHVATPSISRKRKLLASLKKQQWSSLEHEGQEWEGVSQSMYVFHCIPLSIGWRWHPKVQVF